MQEFPLLLERSELTKLVTEEAALIVDVVDRLIAAFADDSDFFRTTKGHHKAIAYAVDIKDIPEPTQHFWKQSPNSNGSSE